MKRQRLIVALLCAGLATAQTPSPTAVITPNFQNADLAVVAQAVSELTGTTFILDQAAATRKITFSNRRPMSAREFYNTFLSILSVNGMTAMPAGNNTMKIVLEANARTLPGSEFTPTTGPDEMVHLVIPVNNVNAQQVATVLNQLRSQYGVVLAVPGTNSIIVTDRAGNVNRMRNIIEQVDQTSSGDLQVIPLQYATAADVVATLTQLTGGQQQAANAAASLVPRVTADPRTNSVLVVGEAAARLQIAAWVANLDTPLAGDGGEPQVIYLKFGDAETMAPLLKEFATGIAQAQAVAAAGGTTAAGGGAAPAASASSAADRSTTILAEPSTNALIVTAPPKMMRELQNIIASLDIPRAQVFIEAIIAEVSTDKASDLGVNWAIFSNEDGTITPAGGFIAPVAGASIVNLAGGIANPESLLTPNAVVPQGATIGLGRLRDNGLNFAAMIRALRTDGDTNVIAEPKLLALDNEESVFSDGQEVPFLGSFTSSLGGGGGGGGGGGAGGLNLNPTTSVNRQQIGTTLTITPQINDGGAMTLDIQLESSELAGTTGDAGSQITNKREFDTKVRVDDGQTIVLAGMIRNFERNTETRVPFLGRIPLLGELFKVRGAQRQQKMLMVFIRPKILTDSLQADALTGGKYNQIREQQIKQGERREILPLLPGNVPPELPELDQPQNPIQPTPAPAGGATTNPVP
ncbi:MAG TPA: type II secretion system secretin GspD [Steroidobacteraceae bacterium]|nr:type II secretion system secretin GspD [Steroidobacteraceae bacterium]